MLIVIAIIAILAAIIILAINPIEQMKKTRDARRMADLQSLNQALQYAELDLDPSSQMGSSSVVYVSLPSSNSDCSDLGLPALDSPWTYHCSSQDNYRKPDGSGWVPVNFTSLKAVPNALTILPIDPLNTASSPGYYYTYVTGGSWKLTAVLESSSNANKAINDGGTNPNLYETGTNLSLASFYRETVGYWKFDEGSGQVAFDSSGYQNNGTLVNGPTWTTGKIGNALSFDGVDDYVDCGNNIVLNPTQEITVEAWIKQNILPPHERQWVIVSKHRDYLPNNQSYLLALDSSSTISFYISEYGQNFIQRLSDIQITDYNWHHVAGVFKGSTILDVFIDGVQHNEKLYFWAQAPPPYPETSTIPSSIAITPIHVEIGCWKEAERGNKFNGLIDEVRIYNRALSADEILQHYQAGL
jgi:type II secretory pathway pseudopilin PulG